MKKNKDNLKKNIYNIFIKFKNKRHLIEAFHILILKKYYLK